MKGKLKREALTIDKMISLYCRDLHGNSETLCEGCATLRAYALARVGTCRFGAGKPACANCPIHCFKPAMRDAIRILMRYAGPRMLLRHPWLALMHVIDSAGSRRPAVGEGATKRA
jgi:hypothetical protein